MPQIFTKLAQLELEDKNTEQRKLINVNSIAQYQQYLNNNKPFFEVISLLCRLVDYFQETTCMHSRIPLRSKPHFHATNRSNILYKKRKAVSRKHIFFYPNHLRLIWRKIG